MFWKFLTLVAPPRTPHLNHPYLLIRRCRYNSRRERTKFKRALQKAEWVERMAAKTARTKAMEEEEAKKIPYEVC